LQKHHADYGDHCEAQEKAQSDEDASQTLAQTSADIDLEENHKAKDFSKTSGKDFDEALAKAQSWAVKYKTADDIPDNLIPE